MPSSSNQAITFIGLKSRSKPLMNLLFTITCGILFVFSRLSLKFKILLGTDPSAIEDADLIILKDQYGAMTLVEVEVIKVKFSLNLKRYIRDGICRVIDTVYGRFIYDYILGRYVFPGYIPSFADKTFEEIYQDSILKNKNEESLEIYEKTIIFGKNTMNALIPSNLEIILKNIIEPFFIWELMSFIIWIMINYVIYAYVVGTIYLFMLLKNLKNDFNKKMDMIKARHNDSVMVLRGGSFKLIKEELVLPGDIIQLRRTDRCVCDAQVIKGDVITDESMLTGESIPICKEVGNIVYAGTRIIKSSLSYMPIKSFTADKLVKLRNITKENSEEEFNIISEKGSDFDDCSIGLVLKTGKQTKRGTIFRNLSIKRPSSNEFESNSTKVIFYLILSVMLLAVGCFTYLYNKMVFSKTVKYTVDMSLTFFSPSLYTCLQLGIQYSKAELEKKKIFTSDPTRINTAGQVDMAIFDKTGTLTELGVDILCYDNLTVDAQCIEDVDILSRVALSTCHYLVVLDNQYSGDVLDMKMFLYSKSKITNKDNRRFIEIEVENKYEPVCKEYSENDGDLTLFFNSADNSTAAMGEQYPEDTFEVLKIYDFDLFLKRLSVIVRNHAGKQYIFCKGAPDQIRKILIDVPKGYTEKCKNYALNGHRVLAVAYKEVSNFTGSRENDEKDLIFLGLLVFANKLKTETSSVIKELKDGDIIPKMCTGDNILTAISVAKECGMIDHSVPVLFPVLDENCKTQYDVEWYCIADEDYIFDKLKMVLYSMYDRDTTYDFVIAIESNEYHFFKDTVYYSLIMEKGVVFSRFNPDDKKDLVESYSRNGLVSMFCGDGANDTGALCAADVGVSLASNEASLAAPFNSLHLSSVLDVIKEGRSSLAMSSAQFKYILFSQGLAGIQIFVLILFISFPPDTKSLVNDLMSCYILGYALANFKAANVITKKKFSPNILRGSLVIAIELIVIFVSYYLNLKFLVDEPISSEKNELGLYTTLNLETKRSAYIFFSTGYLLISKVVNFGAFSSYRQSRLSNPIFICYIAACTICFSVIVGAYFYMNNPISSFFDFQQLTGTENKFMILNIPLTIFLSVLPYDKLIRSFIG